MVKALNIIYTPSDSIVAQGKDVQEKRKQGYYEKQGGNGTYRMVKPSTAILAFEADGKRHSCSVKELIRDVYCISRVSEKQATRFFNDVQSGHIKLEYSDGRGLRLA